PVRRLRLLDPVHVDFLVVRLLEREEVRPVVEAARIAVGGVAGRRRRERRRDVGSRGADQEARGGSRRDARGEDESGPERDADRHEPGPRRAAFALSTQFARIRAHAKTEVPEEFGGSGGTVRRYAAAS